MARGLVSGVVDDAQAGAFAMGICRAPLPEELRVALTLAMRDSGAVLTWDLPGPVVDKHSTGGVGDPISLVLGPALAAVGAYVPMLSGRGLGHTGGTLDKLEAIPGLTTEVDTGRFQALVAEVGCAVVSASKDIAPADRRLYAIRDVTGTVQSIDLITASILSKKLAGGVGPLVLDVKVGSGAFMASVEEAEALARALVDTANGAAGPCSALITDMNQPAAASLGNALEIMDVLEALTLPNEDSLITRLVLALGGELMCSAGMVTDPAEGAAQLFEAIRSGAAAERFGRMVAAMGGPRDFVEHWRDRLPAAPVVREVVAPRAGVVSAMNGQSLGRAVLRLGGGRQRAGDRIDPSVGLSGVARIGEPVEAGDPLALVHGSDLVATEALAEELSGAFTISDAPVIAPELIKLRVG
ncbi:Thymidine phosphorylase [Candidatus Rhodobacter oscarellae]|uniref:thymidine phosphorylase n=2 Tax=Candidatus Rhodobacter oscarellae TaxID=1675527 RepID=A0A0J9ED12_9RHOB|nr:Thymidine phosphorylase [Candidatus Rhodobacter lobularis]